MASGRRRRGTARREVRSEQSYSQEEMASVRRAADQSGMTAGAFIAQAAVRMAAPGGPAASETLRGALIELSETAWRIRQAHRKVDEAARQADPAGKHDPCLREAAGELLAYAERFDTALLRLQRAL